MSSLKEKLFPEWINDSEEKLYDQVFRDPIAIRFIPYPSEKLQLVALNSGSGYIQFIYNPTEVVQLKSVSTNGIAIKYIRNPSRNVQLAAVNNKPSSIKFIHNPSEEIQMEAIIASDFDWDVILYCPDWRKLWDKIQDMATIKDIIE